MSNDDWRAELDEFWLSRAQHETDLDDWKRARWQMLIVSEEAARNRRLLDDEERRCDGLFDRDRELRGYWVDWGDDA